MKQIIVDIINWYIYEKKPPNYNYEEIKKLISFSQKYSIEGIVIDFAIDNFVLPITIYEELIKRREDLKCISQKYIELAQTIGRKMTCEKINFVFLKGITLSNSIYKEKYHRQFSDIDFLTNEVDLKCVEEYLLRLGFIQGEYINNRIEKASRDQILFQKLYTHEIYNFIRSKNGLIENVDVNFKFSWAGIKNEYEPMKEVNLKDILVEENIITKNEIALFKFEYQFVHLCCHLYNELCFFELDLVLDESSKGQIKMSWIIDIILLIFEGGLKVEKILHICQENNCKYKIDYALTIVDFFYCLDKNIKEIFDCKSKRVNYYYNKAGERIAKKENWLTDIYKDYE